MMATTTYDSFRAVSTSRSIAPKKQMDLGASDASSADWEGIDSDIEVSVLALWAPGDPRPILLVTLDLLYPGKRIRSAIELAAAPLPADRIVVAASHTHRAPMTDDTKPSLGVPDEQYMVWLIAQLSEAVQDALGGKQTSASVAVGEAKATHSINRRLRKALVVARRPRLNDFVNAPNPDGPTDERLTALVIRDIDGRPIALVWNYACHPVGGPVRNAVSAHYPGAVRDRIRIELGQPSLPVLFFQGFSGDVRPNASTKIHSMKRRLRRIISGRLFEDMTWPAYEAWCAGLSTVLLSALESAAPILNPELTSRRVVVPATQIARGKGLGEVSFAQLKFGEVLTILAASGEPVVDYSIRFRATTPSRFVMCVGCTDEVIGYIPTSRIQTEGGYEGGGFTRAFGLDSLEDGIEEVVNNAFCVLADDDGDRADLHLTDESETPRNYEAGATYDG